MGEVQAVTAAPSRLHLKAAAGLEVKKNVAEVLATVPVGPAVIVTLGALNLAELDGNAGPAATAADTRAEIKRSVFTEVFISLRFCVSVALATRAIARCRSAGSRDRLRQA